MSQPLQFPKNSKYKKYFIESVKENQRLEVTRYLHKQIMYLKNFHFDQLVGHCGASVCGLKCTLARRKHEPTTGGLKCILARRHKPM